jgi:hypothetical protein
VPILCARDQFGSSGIALDVAAEPKEMAIVLDRDRLEPALVDRTSSPGSPGVAPLPGVRGRQPLHEQREAVVVQGPEHQVPVIWHDAVGEQAYREATQRLGEDLEERFEVGWALEQGHALDGPVQDVKHELAG